MEWRDRKDAVGVGVSYRLSKGHQLDAMAGGAGLSYVSAFRRNGGGLEESRKNPSAASVNCRHTASDTRPSALHHRDRSGNLI